MLFAIYCNNLSSSNLETTGELMSVLTENDISFIVYKNLNEALKRSSEQVFDEHEALPSETDVLITIGGDGTILNAVPIIYGSKIPVLGINTGRLGFLTSITMDEIQVAIDKIRLKQVKIEERTLLQLTGQNASKLATTLALNEISVLKKNSSSMITIHAELDGEFLNTYWADGLIISTATGSTAYSLSCGGPILIPRSENFIITPIAPHNLNVRPLVIPDSSKLSLSFETRSSDILIALDSTSAIVTDTQIIEIQKAPHKIGLLRLDKYSYLETLRSKLNWGLDKRN